MRAGPERDREIEAFQRTIEHCAARAFRRSNIIFPSFRSCAWTASGTWNAYYSAGIMPHWRRRRRQAACAPRRRRDWQNPPSLSGFRSDTFWERITYFLERVVPVANQYKVRLAQHPHDPGMPPAGVAGIPNVLGTIEGLKRFCRHPGEPYHGSILPGNDLREPGESQSATCPRRSNFLAKGARSSTCTSVISKVIATTLSPNAFR